MDDPAAVLGPVVPARPLRGLPVALEDPVAEFAAHGQDPAEEPGLDQPAQLEQARQVQLVVHHAVLDPGPGRGPGQAQGAPSSEPATGFSQYTSLPGGDRLEHGRLPRRGDLGVEVDLQAVVGQQLVQVGAPALQAVPLRDRADPLRAAADQRELDRPARAVGQRDAALVADRQQRPDQVLPVAHAPGDAVHDDAEGPAVHGAAHRRFLVAGKVDCISGCF